MFDIFAAGVPTRGGEAAGGALGQTAANGRTEIRVVIIEYDHKQYKDNQRVFGAFILGRSVISNCSASFEQQV